MGVEKEWLLTTHIDMSETIKKYEDGKFMWELEKRGDIIRRLSITRGTAKRLLKMHEESQRVR